MRKFEGLEKEIIEDVNKILIKLNSFPTLDLTDSEYGGPFLPSIEQAWDDPEKYFVDPTNEENPTIKPDVLYEGYYDDEVKFAEHYDSVKLSVLKELLQIYLRRQTGSDEGADILSDYHNSTC